MTLNVFCLELCVHLHRVGGRVCNVRAVCHQALHPLRVSKAVSPGHGACLFPSFVSQFASRISLPPFQLLRLREATAFA